MQTLENLNTRYAIANHVSFTESDGLIVAEIDNAHATASICLQGAHLMTWTPKGQQPVIWLSSAAKLAPGKSIRGGVPVCWPWFGPHAAQASFPGHGFARTVMWEVIATKALKDGGTWLAFRLLPTDATRAQWPHPCELVLQIVIGKTLDMDLGTLNTGKESITIGDALHTYFEVSDVSEVAIHGLDGTPYIDKVGGSAQKQQAGPVSIYQEVDRIYFNTGHDCVIEDPAWKRRIRITKLGSHSTVVWNPWIEKANKMGDLGENGYLNMLCVESTNAADDVVTIAPKQEHHLWVRYSVEALR
jgi:glucose-6-phosphate 1-epimerase